MTRKAQTKPKSRPIVAGTGLLALDEVINADKATPVYSAGGTCGNVLIILSYLGWNAQPVARLGNDYAAELIREDIGRWKVSDRFIRSEDGGSTPVIVERIGKDSKGLPTHSFSWRCASCGARYPSYRPELASIAEEVSPKLSKAAVFFFDRVSAGAIVLATAARQYGALIVFEPSGIGNPIHFRQAWSLAHIVKYSHQRLSDFPDLDVENNPFLTIETLGEDGLRYRYRQPRQRLGKWVESKAFPVENLKDAAGSGDWCTAGILSQVGQKGLSGFSRSSVDRIAAAIQYGQALAAWNCRFEGARGGMYSTSRAEFRKQIDEIFSGTTTTLPAKNGVSADFRKTSTICRACEPSRSRSRRKHS